MDCPTCGARNDDRYRFCGTCGQKLQEQASIPGNREPIDREPPPETRPAYNPYRGPEPIDQEPPPQTAPETAPGYSPYRGPDTFPARIPNYLIPAILVTLFCCVPFGIIAIVYAAQVNGKVALGDIEGALRTSRSAKKWAWVSFGTGLLITVGWVIYIALGLAGSDLGGLE